MADIIKNIPKSQEEISNNLIEVYPLSGAYKPSIDTKKRGNDISVKEDNVKDFTIGLHDIDGIIKYYFENIIKPYVTENESKVNVPIIYASPEMWKTAQRDGIFKDKAGKILFPVIAYRRDNIEKVRDLGNRLDGNQARLYYNARRSYSKKNAYDRFSILSNRVPVEEWYSIAIPDFLNITYNCSISVNYIEDMNKIIESIMYTSDSYWGDPERFKFKAKIDNIPTTNEYQNGEDRIIKSNFDIQINGHIIPDVINKDLSTKKKFYSKSQIIFTLETAGSDFFENGVITKEMKKNTATLIDSANSSNMGINPAILNYLIVNKQKATKVITANSAIFTASFLLAPPGLTATSKDNFTYFANGQLMEPEAILSFVDNGNGTCTLIIDPVELEFSFESGWEISAVGKFQ